MFTGKFAAAVGTILASHHFFTSESCAVKYGFVTDVLTQPSGGDGKWQMANRKSLHDLAAGCTGFGRVVQRVASLEIFQEIEPVIACLLCRLPGCSLMLR